MANNTINDGSVVGGSRPITIGSQLYDTDDFSIDFDITRYVRTSSNNIPTGKKVIQGEQTGSATLQYPSSSIARPVFGDTFTTTEDSISCTWHVEKVGKRLVKAGEAKIPITFSLDISTVVLSVAT